MRDEPFQAYPKPPKKEKATRKRLMLRPKGKRRHYSTKQKEKREKDNERYIRFTRPSFLITKAREQSRLSTPDFDIPGDTPQEKLGNLSIGERPLCSFALEETGCNGNRIGLTIHHVAGRDGKKLNDIETFINGCDECHQYVESHREWAMEQGYLRTRHQKIIEFQDS